MIVSVPAYVLPDTAALLVSGGDERIALDTFHQKNKYGCRATYTNGLVGFGSCTASGISAEGFAAAERLRARIAGELRHFSPVEVYRREMRRMRRAVLDLCGLSGTATDLIFAASGTDIHLIAAQLASTLSDAPLHIIMVCAEESGSGVPHALGGRHFSAATASSLNAGKGEPIAAHAIAGVSHVALRNAQGAARDLADIDADVSGQAQAAISAGQHVLLVVTDVSKTGCIAPSPQCAIQLQHQYRRRLHVLVDACQWRITHSSLRAYLEQGFMVAITGSKFASGPSFSGALLLPDAMRQLLHGKDLTAAIHNYSIRDDWPEYYLAAHSLEPDFNFGLLLRWEVALHELRAFYAIPEARARYFMQRFSARVLQRLNEDDCFEVLDSTALDRQALGHIAGWDEIPGIMAFVIYKPGKGAHGSDRQALSRAQTRQVYERLQDPQYPHISPYLFQLGQPVECGERGGVPVTALRLCISARLVAQAVGDMHGDGGDAVIEQAMLCLDEIVAMI
ncbi:hypothetical protein [Undibacterium terreum]|uniref:Uncharacterized protein n=1 Tax=Undibacterium terreum TaxID=1224302 RepID=A0A916XBN8_9BURK|nr:hypothetical protein [Undibacterium terreum]GGC62054.1 hypothetical protein GCM10011396_06160 [Undibacterium terreum]